MGQFFGVTAVVFALAVGACGTLSAQSSGASAPAAPAQAEPAQAAPQPQQDQAAPPDQPAPPKGKVLFSRDLDTPAGQTAAPDAKPEAAPGAILPAATPAAPRLDDSLQVADADRDALTFSAYDLDAHLTPASAGVSIRAGLTVRNDGQTPLFRLTLQVTSTLHWEAVSQRGAGSGPALTPLKFVAHLVETDADHTGAMDEAVVTLPEPLAPGASIALTAMYSGTIAASAERLERIGAPTEKALFADWDGLSADSATDLSVALRGFGDVLWYPVSAAPAFLGDGAKLFQAIGQTKLRQARASMRLRLAVEYVGDPPDAAWFCGHAQHLVAISDNANVPVAESPGVATATFAAQPLGFRVPSLFVTSHPPTLAADGLISGVTENFDALSAYGAAAGMVEPMLTDWLGPRPLTPLGLLDHAGQPFEDDALLVRPMTGMPAPEIAPSLVHSLTHAWVRSNYPWIDEGLPEFMSLLWTERRQSRAAAMAELQDAVAVLAIGEPPPVGTVASQDVASRDDAAAGPASSSSSSSSSSSLAQAESEPPPEEQGQPLIRATSDVYYRTKAAAVFWMLRGLVGEDTLKKALQAYRADPKADRDPEGFERTLELSTQQDMRWFFNDWVYRDRGLPDLTLVNVTPRQIEGSGGRDSWLVSVDVRNDGDAVADVPVTVRSTTSSETERLRIPGRSSASVRIVFPSTPDEVVVNDGEVPETRSSSHTVKLVLPAH